MNNFDNLLKNYNFDIPQELIAQTPADKRQDSKLIVLNRKTKKIQNLIFTDIVDFLSGNDLLVINTTKVIPARLYGKKKTGGKVEILFLNPALCGAFHNVLMKPYVKPGERVYFEDGYECTVHSISETYKTVEFNKNDILNLLEKRGFMPLPPYIKRKNELAQSMSGLDRERYQTVYANEKGAIAAPTAGLHFTKDILEKLSKKNVEIAQITLHVGWGTFKPVESETVNDHKMLPENYIVDESNTKKINDALTGGKRIIAVGTTTVRTLETVAKTSGTYNDKGVLSRIEPSKGSTDIFIYPGYEFKIVGAMLTNLHLPCSTPLMMASAFAGREFILSAYKEAVARKYRFFSYGDSMFIE